MRMSTFTIFFGFFCGTHVVAEQNTTSTTADERAAGKKATVDCSERLAAVAYAPADRPTGGSGDQWGDTLADSRRRRR